jgi:hypothetical protein
MATPWRRSLVEGIVSETLLVLQHGRFAVHDGLVWIGNFATRQASRVLCGSRRGDRLLAEVLGLSLGCHLAAGSGPLVTTRLPEAGLAYTWQLSRTVTPQVFNYRH